MRDVVLNGSARMLLSETVWCRRQLLEDVIREHLGWLVLWGNVFGKWDCAGRTRETCTCLCALSPRALPSPGVPDHCHALTFVMRHCVRAGGLIGLVSQAVGFGV